MNYARCSKAAFLVVLMVMFVGCKSKQEKTAQPQDQAAAPAVTPEGQPGAPAVSPQDKADAQAAAARVLALMESGDFSAVYQGSAAGFRQIGSEAQFVGKFQQTRKNVGVLKNPRETSFGTLPGPRYVLVYRLGNDRYQTDMRLTFARAKSAKMELAG